MLRGQDILVLVALLRRREQPTLQRIGSALVLDVASVHRSLKRLEEVQLVHGRQPLVPQADEFLSHGFRYVFPPIFKGESRGMPTAWAAPPLSERLAPSQGPPPVWPDPGGRVRGIALEPLHDSVVKAAQKDEELYERFAALDALRWPDARVRREGHAVLFPS